MIATAKKIIAITILSTFIPKEVGATPTLPLPPETQTQTTTVITPDFSHGRITQEAILQGLDKITARISTIRAPLNSSVKFEKLHITVRKCWKSAPEDPPESIAYVDIIETKLNQTSQTIFSGWLFSSNPTVSALEHPVYDVWLKECGGASRAYTPPHPENSLPSLPSAPGPHPDEPAPSPSQQDEKMKALYRGLDVQLAPLAPAN